MKKFIALLLFAGLASAGFAKSGYGSENKNQSYGSEYPQLQSTLPNYAPKDMQNDLAYSEAGYSRDRDHDGYSRGDHWYRHHRHERRHRHDRRRFHRDRY